MVDLGVVGVLQGRVGLLAHRADGRAQHVLLLRQPLDGAAPVPGQPPPPGPGPPSRPSCLCLASSCAICASSQPNSAEPVHDDVDDISVAGVLHWCTLLYIGGSPLAALCCCCCCWTWWNCWNCCCCCCCCCCCALAFWRSFFSSG